MLNLFRGFIMKTVSLHRISLAKKIAFSALFAAICCVATLLIVVPLPNGYFNTGDIFVLLSGWCLGPVYGSLAAAIGSGLADLINGFAAYAPATFFIKGVDALLSYFVWTAIRKLIQKEKLDFVARTISAVVGEACMVLGYFLFECILYGFGGATLALIGNTLQGACCGACAVILISALYPIKGIKGLFPSLHK